MKRTRGSSLYYHYGVSEYCGWEDGESSRKPRKSSQREYPYCIFCNALMRKTEMKSGVEKEEEKIEDIVDLVGQEEKVGTKNQVVEVEVEEVSMEKLLEELKKEEEETPMGEDENANATAINGGGGENFEDGSMDLLSTEDLAAVDGILNGLDLAGWGEWHFEDDMIWREWEADWVYGYSHHWVTLNSDASHYWDLEAYEASLAQDWVESLWVLDDNDTQN